MKYLALIVALWSVFLHIQPQREDALPESDIATYPHLYVVEKGIVVDSKGPYFCMIAPGETVGMLFRENVFLGVNWPYRKGLTEGVYTCEYHQDTFSSRPWNRRNRVFL